MEKRRGNRFSRKLVSLAEVFDIFNVIENRRFQGLTYPQLAKSLGM